MVKEPITTTGDFHLLVLDVQSVLPQIVQQPFPSGPLGDLAEKMYERDLRSRGSLSARSYRSPVSNHSSDFPNSRLILSRITAPISTFPCSIVREVILTYSNAPRKLLLGYVKAA